MTDQIDKEQLEFVKILADSYTTITHYYEDEDGNEDYCLDPSFTVQTFIKRIEQEKIKQPFSKEKFLHNKDIIDTIEGFEIDIEKFWYALLFIYDYVETMSVGCVGKERKASVMENLNSLCEYLIKFPKSKITLYAPGVKKKGAVEIEGNIVLGTFIKEAIIEKWENTVNQFNADPEGTADHRSLLTSNTISFTETTCEKEGYMVAMAEMMYRTLFDKLGLERKKGKCKHRSSVIVSFDRLLLVARIVYMYGFTKTESYLVSGDGVKDRVAEYKNREIVPPINAKY